MDARQRHLARPLLDLCKQICQRCTDADLPQPSRNTFARRWPLYREEQHAFLANDPRARKAFGNVNAKSVLGIVQIDHTQVDAFVFDPWLRRFIGQPWLTLAVNIASRWVVGLKSA